MKMKWLIIISISIVILMVFYLNPLVRYHNVVPSGEKYKTTEQIRDDLNYLYYGKYNVYKVSLTNIEYYNDPLMFEKEMKILQPYLHSKNNKVLSMMFTDSDKLYSHEDKRGKEIVTREAVNMLYFLTKRRLDVNIKAVKVAYELKYDFFGVPGDFSIVIPLDEYKNEMNKYKKQGYSNEEIMFKLSLHFLKNSK